MNPWHVYVMANKPKGVLYGGCTNNIEELNDGLAATVRELQLKKWKREWKINLIENMNPSWSDLSINLNLNFNKLRDE